MNEEQQPIIISERVEDREFSEFMESVRKSIIAIFNIPASMLGCETIDSTAIVIDDNVKALPPGGEG